MNVRPGFAGRLDPPVGRPFRILQLTDLHLMDVSGDEAVLARIGDLVAFAKPDLVFLTGDQAMSASSRVVYARLSDAMDALGVPWTFVFGNHDAEHGVSRKALFDIAARAKNIRVAAVDGERGETDFYLEVGSRWIVFGLDTRVDATYAIDGKPTWGYDGVRPHQVKWFEDVLEAAGTAVGSVVFQHIPPVAARRFHEPGSTRFHGERNENVSCTPVDFGFEEALVRRRTVAVFYGHDHVNDFAFERDGVEYAFGRCTGDYDYCAPVLPKGGRIVDLHEDGSVDTFILQHRDAASR
ncbi:MAG: metallophosphoesterase [Candidatus Izemoplasmatales bacterium]